MRERHHADARLDPGEAGTYHNFHQLWMSTITNRLNAGLLPPGYFAMEEQIIGRPETDVVALEVSPRSTRPSILDGGTAVATAKPKSTIVMPMPRDEIRYSRKANQVAIHHGLGEVVAVIEIVSPGHKDRERALRSFVEKAVDLMQQGVSLLVIDPFPPRKHDPQGIHAAILEEFTDEPFELPTGKPLTIVSYQVHPHQTAYIEPIALGDRLPDVPLFLDGEAHILVPLEETYLTTWNVLPAELQKLVESPKTA
jgi:hypothetical protein